MGRGRSDCHAVSDSGLRGGRGIRRRGDASVQEVSDDSFAAVLGTRRGQPVSAPVAVAPLSEEALERAARLAEAGGIDEVLERARASGGDFDSVEYLRDVANELMDWAIAEGAGLRAELARLLNAPDIQESYTHVLRWHLHRFVLRNYVRHGEDWMRPRALLSHDKNFGKSIQSRVMNEARAQWLELTEDQERQVKYSVFGVVSGVPPVRADWAAFVPKLRAHGGLERLRPADLRVLYVAHVRERYEREARLEAQRVRRAGQ
jgi:hypothetical protein